MPEIIVTTRDGERRNLEFLPAMSVMQTITEAGIDELLALCGGVCSCATCHVYVDENFLSSLPPMSPDEDALLDCSEHRAANSRLSCQIRLTHEHDGMQVTIAAED